MTTYVDSTYGITYTKTSDLSFNTATVSAYDGSVPIVVIQDSVQIAGTPHTVIHIDPNPTIEYTKNTIDWEVYYDRYPDFATQGHPRTLDWVWSQWNAGGEAAGRIMTLTPTIDNIDWEEYYDRYPDFAATDRPRTLNWIWDHWSNLGKNAGRIMNLKPKLFQSNRYLQEITIPSSVTNIYNNTFDGATNLTSITLLHTTLPYLEEYALNGVSNTCTLTYISNQYPVKDFQDTYMLQLIDNSTELIEPSSGNIYIYKIRANRDGTIIALHNRLPSGRLPHEGSPWDYGFTVYEKTGSTWTQKGAKNTVVNCSSLSGNGNVLVGRASGGYNSVMRAYYRPETNDWKSGGLFGGTAKEIVGRKTSLSYDGNTAALWISSSNTTNEGITGYMIPVKILGTYAGSIVNRNRVFIDNKWNLQDFYYGQYIDLNHEGDILVTGDQFVTRVYKYNPSHTYTDNHNQGNRGYVAKTETNWEQIGGDINPEVLIPLQENGGSTNGFASSNTNPINKEFGNDAALSKNFTFQTGSPFYSADHKLRVVIGTRTHGNFRGHTRVFEYDPTKTTEVTDQASADYGPVGWRRLGASILGEHEGDQSGSVVQMNETGNTIIITAPKNDDGGTDRGHIRVYKYESTANTWNQLGPDFDGDETTGVSIGSDNFTSFSSDGKTLVIRDATSNITTYELKRYTIPALPEAEGDTFKMTSISSDAEDDTKTGSTAAQKRNFTRKAVSDMFSAYQSQLTGSKALKLAAGTKLPGFTIAPNKEITLRDARVTKTYTRDEMANKTTYMVLNDNDPVTLKSAADDTVTVTQSGTNFTVVTPAGTTNKVAGDLFEYDGLSLQFGSLVVNLLLIPPVDLALTAFDSAFVLSQQAVLPDISYAFDVSAEITLTQQISAADLSGVFFFKTDEDITSELVTDTSNVEYYLDRSQFTGGQATLNAMNGIVTTGYYGSNTTDHLGKDFLRDMAHQLFSTHFGVDLFTNEDAVVTDISGKSDVVATDIFVKMGDVDKTNTALSGPDVSYGYYTTDTDSSNTNLTREILNQLLTLAPGRFTDKTTLRLDAGIPGVYGMPFVTNDTISYKLSVTAHASQNTTIATGKSGLETRTYKVIFKVA